jgi:hypothetical protein
MASQSVLKCAIVFFAVVMSLHAGEAKMPQKKQELQFFKLVIDHAAELNLTDDQKQKLLKLRDAATADFDKLKDDADLKALLAQAREARKSGDQQKAKELHKQLRDEIEKKGGDPLAKAVRDGEAQLTADQLTKLKEIQSGKGKKAAKKEPPPETKTAATEKPTATLPPQPSESKPEPVAAKQEPNDAEKDEDREALLELLKENHPDLYERIVESKE